MDQAEALSHRKWECRYHVVFIPKCRRKIRYGGLRQHLGEVFWRLAQQQKSRSCSCSRRGHFWPPAQPARNPAPPAGLDLTQAGVERTRATASRQPP